MLDELRSSALFTGSARGETHLSPLSDKTERVNRTGEPNGTTERVNRTESPIEAEIVDGVKEHEKTVRGSFETYPSQQRRLFRVQTLYAQKMGKRLSKSKIIQEAIDEKLDRLEELLK